MISIVDVRTTLLTALSGLVGQYSTPGGKIPAIQIEPVPTTQTITSGVEVLISRFTDPKSTPFLNSEFELRNTVRVRVVSHNNAVTDAVVTKILSIWPDARTTSLEGDHDTGVLPQTNIYITS